MSHFIQAIYEHGVFRPLEPVQLAEHEQVSLAIAPAIPAEPKTDEVVLVRQREALKAALTAAAQLPIESPRDDGFSGGDHDLILYGWTK